MCCPPLTGSPGWLRQQRCPFCLCLHGHRATFSPGSLHHLLSARLCPRPPLPLLQGQPSTGRSPTPLTSPELDHTCRDPDCKNTVTEGEELSIAFWGTQLNPPK